MTSSTHGGKKQKNFMYSRMAWTVRRVRYCTVEQKRLASYSTLFTLGYIDYMVYSILYCTD